MMKKNVVMLVLAFIVSGFSFAQEIKWMSFDEALEAQKKKPKKIFMDVYTNWCGPCQMLEKNTFKNKDVAKYISENYYAVKFNAEGNEIVNYKGQKFENKGYDPAKSNRRNSVHPFSMYLQVQAYPTMIFFDEKGEYIQPLESYLTPSQIEIFLKIFAGDDFKNIKTREDFQKYQANFKGTFKD